eukprot:scaffold263691_cov36-Tisochrysis_lutea.AAC.2
MRARKAICLPALPLRVKRERKPPGVDSRASRSLEKGRLISGESVSRAPTRAKPSPLNASSADTPYTDRIDDTPVTDAATLVATAPARIWPPMNMPRAYAMPQHAAVRPSMAARLAESP